MRSARILRRVLENWGDLLERPLTNVDVKNSKGQIITIMIIIILWDFEIKILRNFEIQADLLVPAIKPSLVIINIKRLIDKIEWIDRKNLPACCVWTFVLQADYRVKKTKKVTNTWILLKNKKKAVEHVSNGETNCNLRPKGLIRGLEKWEIGGRLETIQTTALLRSVRILRRVLETWEDLLSFSLQWKKNSQGV